MVPYHCLHQAVFFLQGMGLTSLWKEVVCSIKCHKRYHRDLAPSSVPQYTEPHKSSSMVPHLQCKVVAQGMLNSRQMIDVQHASFNCLPWCRPEQLANKPANVGCHTLEPCFLVGLRPLFSELW